MKGRKETVWGKERVFRPKRNKVKKTIFLYQNFKRMAKDKRYTWTVSVIAMIDKDELENGPIMEDAYKEFEDSITSVRNPNKDIKFVIYKYDVPTKTAEIRKSKIGLSCYKLKTVERKTVNDFYAEGHSHLVDFFQVHVAKTKLKKNEEHRHLFIIWGHAAGLGFFKTAIKNKLNSVYEKLQEFSGAEEFLLKKLDTDDILAINRITSQTSVKPELRPHEIYLPAFDGVIGEKNDKWQTLVNEFDSSFNVITAKELNSIITAGLSSEKRNETRPLIEIMLCLSCYVNMIETRFAFRDTALVYIAPHTTISFFGYNYKVFFTLLNYKPEVEWKEMSINITNNYLAKYSSRRLQKVIDNTRSTIIHEVDYLRHVSFSCVKMLDVNQLIAQIKLFIRNIYPIIKENDEFFNKMLLARQMCRSMSVDGVKPLGIIDYENLLIEFFRFLSEKNIKDYNIDILNYFLRGQEVFGYYPGILGKALFINNKFSSQSPGSFSIFLPEVNRGLQGELLQIYYSQIGNSDFLQETGWGLFIELFVNSFDINTKLNKPATFV